MEKRRAHYALDTIKATFSTPTALRITRSALTCARHLGIDLEGIIAVVQGTTREQFYKSMTSDASSAVGQDVYHVPCGSVVLYVKFTTDLEGYLVISFKEK